MARRSHSDGDLRRKIRRDQSPITAGWHSEIDEPLRLQRFIDPEELRRTRFYGELAGPLGWCDIVGATIEKSAHRYTAISSTRGEEAGMRGKWELEIMGLLAPHLRRAVTIHETLDVKDRRLFGLSGALDLAPSPIFLLGDHGELQEANRAAERFLSENSAAKIERGRLFFTDAKIRSTVAAAVAAAVRGELFPAATAAPQTPSGRAFAMEMLPLTRFGKQRRRQAGLCWRSSYRRSGGSSHFPARCWSSSMASLQQRRACSC